MVAAAKARFASRGAKTGSSKGEDEEQGGAAAKGPRSAALVRSRVEPKTFFAAERTFLSWLNLSVLLLFVAMSLLTTATSFANNNRSTTITLPGVGGGGAPGAGSPTASATTSTTSAEAGGGLFGVCGAGNVACRAGLISGIVMAPTAILLMAYSLYQYRTRTAQILRREKARYDDQMGPAVLVLMLVLVLALAYGLTVASLA